jgi:hypothetical protein
MWEEAEKILVIRQAAIIAYEREHGKPEEEVVSDEEEDTEPEEEIHQSSIASHTSIKSGSSTSLSTLTGFSALSMGTPPVGPLFQEISAQQPLRRSPPVEPLPQEVSTQQPPRRSVRQANSAIGISEEGTVETWENQADGPSYSSGTIRCQELGKTGWVITNGIVVSPGVKRAISDRSNEEKKYRIYRRNHHPVYVHMRPPEVTKVQIQEQLMGDDNERIGIERNDGSMLYFSRPPGDGFFMPWFSNEDITWRDFLLNQSTSSSSSSTSQDTNWDITRGKLKPEDRSTTRTRTSNRRGVSFSTDTSSSSSSSSGKG